MSFKDMKKNRMSFDELNTELEKSSKGGGNFQKDDRMWYPALDEAKNGFAIIRFLPASEGDDLPFVKMFSHGFKNNNQWLIENCPTTIGKECPVCESNTEMCNSGNKEGAKGRFRKTNYYANVYIVQDKKNPENEGQVRLFRFGTKIFDKLMGASKPAFEDEDPINPFDMWEGANFKLKIRQVERQTNYDSSEFEAPSQLLPTDDEMEAVWKSQYKLSEIIGEDKFKSYEDIEKRLNKVLGNTQRVAPSATHDEDVAEQASVGGVTESSSVSEESEDDDVMSYFQNQ